MQRNDIAEEEKGCHVIFLCDSHHIYLLLVLQGKPIPTKTRYNVYETQQHMMSQN